jgi:arsenate reductase (thioredoxin)
LELLADGNRFNVHEKPGMADRRMTTRVLILCTCNSARSQMAEGLWNACGSGEWEAFSAGSRPTGFVHPVAIQAMAELGIDITGQQRELATP